MVFTNLNIGSILLVCNDKSQGIYTFCDKDLMNLHTYKGDESVRICDMKNYIYHESDFHLKNFFVPSFELSRFDFLFLKNEVDNGNLTIDGKTYYKPSMYLVKQIMTQNEFTENLLFNNYNVEQNTVRFILHKIPPDAKGIENNKNREFLSMISEYLCEKN